MNPCRRGHDRDVVGVYEWKSTRSPSRMVRECRACRAINQERYRKGNPYVRISYQWIWDDDAAEYWFMRHELGLAPREIGDKLGVRWESFQRTLWRRIGGKHEW